MAADGLPGIAGLIEGGIKGVGDIFGNIIEKFKADPTKVVELQADMEQAKISAGLEAQRIANTAEQIRAGELEATIKDMQSARDREIAIATSDKAPIINKIIQPLMALIIVAATFTIWAMILFRHYEPKTDEAIIIGALTTICASVVNYYFGSSSGSAQKSKQLDKLANQ